MSAFFVSNEDMQNVIAGFGVNVSPTALGKSLFRLNMQAMLARYPYIKGTDEEREMEAEVEDFEFGGRECTTIHQIEMAKDATSSLLYQCSEGDIDVDTNELFAMLDAQDDTMKERLKEAMRKAQIEFNKLVNEFTKEQAPKNWTMAETGRAIKKALKEAFPNTKFSVSTKHRGTVSIEWTNGPTHSDVGKIAGAFKRPRSERFSHKLLTFEGQAVRALYEDDFIGLNRNVTGEFKANCKKAIVEKLNEEQRAALLSAHNHDYDRPHLFIGTPPKASPTLSKLGVVEMSLGH